MADKELNRKIDSLASAIERLIASPVAPVAPVLPVAPVAPIAPLVNHNVGDHDTIIELVSSVRELDKKVDAMSEKLDNKYTTKEEHQIVANVQIDHERRIQNQENITTKLWAYGASLVFAVGVVEVLLNRYVLK